jgi:hypothetical protein
VQIAETPGARFDLLVLTRASPSRAQKLLAFVVVPGILAVIFTVSRPFAGVLLGVIDVFVPFYVTFIFLNSRRVWAGTPLDRRPASYALALYFDSAVLRCSRWPSPV